LILLALKILSIKLNIKMIHGLSSFRHICSSSKADFSFLHLKCFIQRAENPPNYDTALKHSAFRFSIYFFRSLISESPQMVFLSYFGSVNILFRSFPAFFLKSVNRKQNIFFICKSQNPVFIAAAFCFHFPYIVGVLQFFKIFPDYNGFGEAAISERHTPTCLTQRHREHRGFMFFAHRIVTLFRQSGVLIIC